MVHKLPVFEFGGGIYEIRNYYDDAYAELLFREENVLGFDMDWKFGELYPSVIHIASKSACAVWYMSDEFLVNFPPYLLSLLEGTYPKIYGFGMLSDNTMLFRLGIMHTITDISCFYGAGKLRELVWLVLGINYGIKNSLSSWKHGINAAFIRYSVCDAWFALMLVLYYKRTKTIWTKFTDPIGELRINGEIDVSLASLNFPWMKPGYNTSKYYTQ